MFAGKFYFQDIRSFLLFTQEDSIPKRQEEETSILLHQKNPPHQTRSGKSWCPQGLPLPGAERPSAAGCPSGGSQPGWRQGADAAPGRPCGSGPRSRSLHGWLRPQVARRSPPLGCAQTRPQHVTDQSLLHSKLSKLCPPGPRPRTHTPLLIMQLTGYADANSRKEEL